MSSTVCSASMSSACVSRPFSRPAANTASNSSCGTPGGSATCAIGDRTNPVDVDSGANEDSPEVDASVCDHQTSMTRSTLVVVDRDCRIFAHCRPANSVIPLDPCQTTKLPTDRRHRVRPPHGRVGPARGALVRSRWRGPATRRCQRRPATPTSISAHGASRRLAQKHGDDRIHRVTQLGVTRHRLFDYHASQQARPPPVTRSPPLRARCRSPERRQTPGVAAGRRRALRALDPLPLRDGGPPT